MRKSIIAILMTFCLSIMTYAQTPRDRATELKEQAQSSLNQKDYIKARYLFKKAYSTKKITSKHVTYSKRHTKHLQPAKTIHRQ